MPNREFEEWRLHYRQDPFGSFRDDLRAGTVISPLINLVRLATLKNPTFTQPTDWVLEPVGKAPLQEQDWKQMRDMFKGLANEMNKQAKQRKKKDA